MVIVQRMIPFELPTTIWPRVFKVTSRDQSFDNPLHMDYNSCSNSIAVVILRNRDGDMGVRSGMMKASCSLTSFQKLSLKNRGFSAPG